MSQPPPPGITQPVGHQPPQPSKKRRNRVLIGVGATLAVCLICGVIGLAAVARGGGSATPTVAAQGATSVSSGTSVAAVGGQSTSTATGATARPTEAAKPTATTKSEPTVKPTNTPVPPKPTNTPIPPPKVFGVNELASVKNWDLAVAATDRLGKEFVWSEFNNKSLAAGTWFIVALDMKNTGTTNYSLHNQ